MIDAEEEEFLVALHEAGHAVLAYRFKRGPTKIALYKRDGVTTGGITRSRTGLNPEDVEPGNPKSFEDVGQCILCTLGGIGAEFLYRGYATRSDADYHRALTLLRYWNQEATPEDLEFYFSAAQMFLSDRESWGAVLELADVLRRKRKLSGYQARQVIYNSDRVESTLFPVKATVLLKE